MITGGGALSIGSGVKITEKQLRKIEQVPWQLCID